jgi:hypothetical protein
LISKMLTCYVLLKYLNWASNNLFFDHVINKLWIKRLFNVRPNFHMLYSFWDLLESSKINRWPATLQMPSTKGYK